MRALNIIEAAYRGTLEEQDDTVVWISHAMSGAGAELGVLLRGSAVNYAVKGQDASGLAFGARRQRNAPAIAEDIAALPGKGIDVYVIAEDLAERGIESAEMVAGLTPIARGDIPRLFADYDQIWHW